MGDAAGQASHRFHLLVLRHGLLHPFALDDLVHQAVVGLGQGAGALLDARLQRFVQRHQLLAALLQAGGGALAIGQHVARLVLAPTRAQRRDGSAAQGLDVERALEQDHVAQVGQAGARRPLLQSDRLAKQYDEGEVGPRLLAPQPGMQRRDVDAVQGFLGQDGGARTLANGARQDAEIGGDLASKPVALQHRGHDLGIAPEGREDQYPFFVRAIPVHARPAPSSAFPRDR